MAKITLAPILTAFASEVSLNRRFSDVATHLNDKVLYRDNPSGEANEMKNDLDMNSNRILNLPSATTSNEPITYGQYVSGAEVIDLTGTSVSEELSASADGQTLFTLSVITYTQGSKNLSVYRKGDRLPHSSYVETSTSSITLNDGSAIKDGDEFEFVVNERDISTDMVLASNVQHTPTGSTVTNVASYLNASTFDTLNDAVTSTDLVVGMAVNIKERTTGNGGGAMWDVVLSSTVTENTFNIVQCTGVGTLSLVLRYSSVVDIKEFGGVGGGATDNIGPMQAILDAGVKALVFDTDTYFFSSGFTVAAPISIDLQGSILNFTTTDYSAGFSIQSDNVTIRGGEINVADADPTYSGQGGTSGAAIGAGNQGTGVGFKGMILEDLILSWNRADGNGGAVSIIGSTRNAKLNNIHFKTNTGAVGNVIGVEWGGVAVAEGTGHPHNITITNITVGDLPGQVADRFLVWLSSTFNVDVENVRGETCAGGVMFTAGDNGNEFAPESYRRSVGTGNRLDGLSVETFRSQGVRVVGDATPTTVPYLNNAEMKNLVVNGDTGATAPVGVLVEYSSGVSIDNLKCFEGYFGVNLSVGANRCRIENSLIEESRFSGITIGSASGGVEDNTVEHCQLNLNAQLSAAITHGGVLVANAKNTTIDGSVFGEIGTTETTKYQITCAANVEKININNNYINNIASGGIGIYTGASTDTAILPNGNGNGGESGFTLFGGLPIREIDGAGNITFRSTLAPVGGTYVAGDRVIRSPFVVGSPKGWMCTVSGTPGTWVADAVL